MVIDAHYHPAFFTEVCPTESLAHLRREAMAYYKTPRQEVARILEKMTSSGVERCFLLPHNYTTMNGDAVSNDQMRMLVDAGQGRFIGFAGIDPKQDGALEELERAFVDLHLCGLKLHPSKQLFYPGEESMAPIYELCLKYNKPIVFHGGMSWQPGAPGKYSRPLEFEEIAISYPGLRFCIAHMGFPWVEETAMLLNKYPNIYADTAALYFDSAWEFYEHVFLQMMGPGWLDRSLRHQVMFGSNMPRFEEMRMLWALQKLELREETIELITCKNALEFLGEEDCTWWRS